MNKITDQLGRGSLLVTTLAFLAAVVFPALGPAQSASAGLLTTRKVQLGSSSDGATSTDANGVAVAAGNGGNGASTYHTFTFTPTGATIGSIAFMYCNAPFEGTTCAAPTGLRVDAVNAVTSPSGFTGTYTVNTTQDASTATGTGYFAPDTNACASTVGPAVARQNCILISQTGTSAESGAHSVRFGTGANWITNPTSNGTYYVRILTFSGNNFNTLVDNGTVAFAITDEINIEAKVQEQLKFSVSSSAATVEGTQCDALTGNALIPLGNSGVLDASTAYDAHSFFRVSTNAANGTAVQYSGDTLRTASGGFTITAPAGPTASTVGSEQFGFQFNTGNAGYSNEDLTTLTAAYAGGTTNNGTITNGGTAQFGYSTASVSAPVTIATTPGTQIVTCSTLAVRYIANISPTTEPGIYRTTISFIATPTY